MTYTLYVKVGNVLFCLVGLLVSCVALSVQAQTVGRLEMTKTNTDTYYYYIQPGEATVQVHVMGTVRAPGLYELGEGSDLGTLLSLTGGPQLNIRQRRNEREVLVRLYRPSLGMEEPFYESVSESGNLRDGQTPAPVLQDGDVVFVEVTERPRFGLSHALTIVNTVALLALAIERFASTR